MRNSCVKYQVTVTIAPKENLSKIQMLNENPYKQLNTNTISIRNDHGQQIRQIKHEL